MHQTRKGNRWFFGMKAHIGVDADSGLVHAVTTTAANEADVEQVAYLLHGKERQVRGRLLLRHRQAAEGRAKTKVPKDGALQAQRAREGGAFVSRH